jgi:2-dehydro-3-deoxyphosphogluconate aldolase / (4S)-4-hydroxy-2-oxoglutarate aldolase
MTAAVLDALRAQRVVPVLRSPDAEDAIATALACADAGLTVVELTRSTPDVDRAVAALSARGLTVGVGTLTAPAEVRSVAAAGARFAVSFANPADFVATARACGLAAIPGALTPSEVLAAAQQGADAVKLFPARAVSPAHLADLRAVLPDVAFLATGGLRIADGTARAWLDAGALAVGLGADFGTAARDGAAGVTARARAVLDATALGVARSDDAPSHDAP